MTRPGETDRRRNTAVAVMILSGGASRRFGGSPKACLPVAGEPAVRRMARIAIDEGLEPVIVVVGIHKGEIREALHGLPVEITDNPDWEQGRTGSVQVGLRTVPPQMDVLLWPVDHPFVEAMTLRVLVKSLKQDSMAIWFIPTFRGRGGHPVLLRPPVREKIAKLSVAAPLRSILPQIELFVRRIPVEDPGVTASVDTPENYLRVLEEWRARGAEP